MNLGLNFRYIFIVNCHNSTVHYKGCQCVIVYVSHFWPPNSSPISVRSLTYMPIYLLFTAIYFLHLPPLVFSVCGLGEHVWCTIEGVGRGHTGGVKLSADVRAKLFWCVIYCANPRPDAGSQSGSRSCKVLGSRAPQVIFGYDPATKNLIRPLIQPRTCEMGPSIFSAMSRLKFASTNRASLPSMSSTEITNRE